MRLVSLATNIQDDLERVEDQVNVGWFESNATWHFHRGEFFSRNVGITDVVHLGVKDGKNFFWAEIIDLAVQKVGVVELDACSSYLNRR
jgi:hypothetical protein